MKERRVPIAFDLEVTARCNNDCRHCYINLPAGDRDAQSKELSLVEIERIAGEAVSMGAMWCLLTGGEPLLRDDFFDLYMVLKRMGLLVSVFTNACLVTPEHVELFRRYPPRDIEVTVYGATEATYEQVTRRQGSFRAFVRGLDRLLSSGVKVRLKAMALRSNVHELQEIARFCRARTKDYYRFDPVLHLRFDRDPARNEEIRAERLSPDEVVAVERADEERFGALQKGCNELILPELAHTGCNHLFHCGTGNGSFTVSYDGKFRLCSSLWHPDTIYDLCSGKMGTVPDRGAQRRGLSPFSTKSGTLRDAWRTHVPRVRDLRSSRKEFLERCRVCPIANLCLNCPAHAALETGELDAVVEYFCRVAHARARALGHGEGKGQG
jgi:MoaA/NifB/PqqE/SkfB family radical SAM enzyme